MCVCVCVCVFERGREREREGEGETERERERERERGGGRERLGAGGRHMPIHALLILFKFVHIEFVHLTVRGTSNQASEQARWTGGNDITINLMEKILN